MKHNARWYFCYRTDHAHIVPKPASTAHYDNVIGYGSWYVERLRAIFKELHVQGATLNPTPCSFRLSHEFEPAEALVPYVDQYYTGTELYNYVYSHLVTPMMTPGRDGAGIHPGYYERKVKEETVLPFMLRTERDDDEILPKFDPEMTAEEQAALFARRQASFEEWREASVAYFRDHFAVVSSGLAPHAYPTSPAEPPPTYTYSRCVQQTFNLRANIFATAEAAVRGLRIMIPYPWFEMPNDCDLPALDHAKRAVRLQAEHARFFRFGRMLGETRIETVNGAAPRQLCAWYAGWRDFKDVQPLVDLIGADDELGAEWRDHPLRDFISRCWDKQTPQVDVVISDRIQHRIWERVESGVRSVLYAFANLGNSRADVQFVYGRGLEGTSETRPRRRTIRIIGGVPSAVGPAWAGHLEKNLIMPARSFAAVVIEP